MAEPAYLREAQHARCVARYAGAPSGGVQDACWPRPHREQTMGLPSVRPHGPHQHAGAAGHGRRRGAREGNQNGRSRSPPTATAALSISIRIAGAQLAVAEAARNVACAGAEPIGATNCLNFGNPEKPEIMWQFARAVEGMGAACRALDIPITGGNVSLYNETDGNGVLPTPVLGVVGLHRGCGHGREAGISGRRRRRWSCLATARGVGRKRVPEGDARPHSRPAAGLDLKREAALLSHAGPRRGNGVDPVCARLLRGRACRHAR